MVVGSLVKSCDEELGTVVKATSYQLANDDWKEWVITTHGPAQEIYTTIRPGVVVSVRWQKDATLMTTHVFYEGIEDSVLDIGNATTISIVK
jgi:hypothetical protein